MAKFECNRKALIAAACLVMLEQASAQMIGVDICACLPTTVTFRLNFTFDCDGSNVMGPGINDTSCLIETRGNENVTDFVPTSVSTVQIFELNENREVVGDSTNDQGYFDGSEITYTSIVERDPDSVNSLSTLPRGFQILLTGVNAAEQNVVNLFAIEYTGECGLFPLLEVGEQIGWVFFTDLGDPSERFCPTSTTSAPLLPPTVAPLPLMSEMPSDSPTLPIDSDIPSTSPSEMETNVPVEAPTDVAAPSCPPVDTGGKSGIVNGGSGIAEEYQNMKSGDRRGKVNKATENFDRHLRTGGSVECPEPNQPDTVTKKNMEKDDSDKSPNEDIMKNSKGTKKRDSPKNKNDDTKGNGKMDVSTKGSSKGSNEKGTDATSASKAKHENTTQHNVTLSNLNKKGGMGKDDAPSGEVPSKTPSKSHNGKDSKGTTEDLDDDDSKR